MSLTLVSVPIGHTGDITLRALESLKSYDIIIGEERKPLFKLLKDLGLEKPEKFELLNEHSTVQDIKNLTRLCADHKVVLVTDCGTPGFSDPGAELVAACRKAQIPVTANPGASSLTTFLSLCGQSLKQFHFEGFLPRESGQREKRLEQLSRYKIPILLMDTPYRLQKTLQECEKHFTNKRATLGMDLTKDSELVLTGSLQEILKKENLNKREFLLLIHS